MSQEYDDLNSARTITSDQLSSLDSHLNELSGKDNQISITLDDLLQHSYGFNVNILGVPELNSRESTLDTSNLCVKIFNKKGTEVTMYDINLAHRVSTRNPPPADPRPIICRFVRRLAREQVTEKRQEICNVVLTEVRFTEDSTLARAILLDHLTPKVQQLLIDAKKFKDRFQYAHCWSKNAVVYLRKSVDSQPIKVKDQSVLEALAREEQD